jgi:hypothetical protein
LARHEGEGEYRMKKFAVCAVGAVAVLASGCAGRASTIAPVAISANDYSSLACPEARAELQTRREQVNALSRRQNNAALADAASVFLVLLPLGSVFGADVEGELAQAKGEQLALERHISMHCVAGADLNVRPAGASSIFIPRQDMLIGSGGL